MRIKRTVLTAVGALLVLAFVSLLSGCTDPDSAEFQRLVCEVSAINEGAPLVCAYINVGDPADPNDDTFPIDFAKVEFHARPYANWSVVGEDGPASYFHITEYDLDWTSLQAQGTDLDLYDITGGGVDVLVPVNGTAEVALLIADRYLKDSAFIRDLYTGGREPFTARVDLTFRGHETGNQNQIDNPVAVRGSFMAHFIGAVAD